MTGWEPLMPATTPAAGGTGDRQAGPPVPALSALQPAQPEDPEERADRKRRQIRRAAVGEFLRKGYASTSMDDVAAAARVSKQTVYKPVSYTHLTLPTILLV